MQAPVSSCMDTCMGSGMLLSDSTGDTRRVTVGDSSGDRNSLTSIISSSYKDRDGDGSGQQVLPTLPCDALLRVLVCLPQQQLGHARLVCRAWADASDSLITSANIGVHALLPATGVCVGGGARNLHPVICSQWPVDNRLNTFLYLSSIYPLYSLPRSRSCIRARV